MEPRAHHIVIGLFTVIGLGGALLFALWLGHARSDREYDHFEIGFERAVSGLSEGNPVLYSGIRVGDVLQLRLDPNDPRLVRVLIRVQNDIAIREDTRASLMLANITGAMNIQLHGGSPDSPRLRGSREKPPLIMASPSPFGSLLAESEGLIRNFDQLMTNINRMLSEDNAAHLTRLLGNVEQITATLAEQRDELARAISHIADASSEAEAAFASLARLGDTTQALLDSEGREMLDSARTTLQAMQGVATRLDNLADSHVGTLDESMQAVGDLQPAMRELRSALRQFGRIAERLEDNPAGFLLGREPIKEFSP